MTLIQVFFNTYRRYFYFQYNRHSGQSKIFQNLSFTFLGLPSAKTIEFENVKFGKSISYEDVVCREFRKIDSKVCFQKNERFKNVNVLVFSLVNKLKYKLSRGCHNTNLLFAHVFKIMGLHL